MKRLSRDAGFTLLELVFTIAIMGVITVPLANFVLEYFSNEIAVQARFSESHDVQIAAAFFSRDVANVGLRAATSPYSSQASVWNATSGFPASYCGQGAGATLLLLQWNDWTVSGGTGVPVGPHSVAYVAESSTLHRIYCSSAVTPTSDSIVVHNLVYPDPANGTPVTCQATISSPASPSACNTSTPPDIISLTLSIQAPRDPSIWTPRPVLSGQRRQS